MGRFQNDRAELSVGEARSLVGKSIDYLHGRVMKIRIPSEAEGDEIDTWGYDRDNGEGAVGKIVDAIVLHRTTGIKAPTGPIEPTPVIVHLKNGASLPKAAAEYGISLVMRLARSNDISDQLALYELTQKCRNPDHRFFGNLGKKLIDLGLVERDGTIQKYIQDIVESMAVGEGMETHYINPVRRIEGGDSCADKFAGLG